MIHSPECPLFLEKRDPPLESATLEAMLARPPAMMKYEGAPDGIAAAYANLPADLVADIADLARRFADVMGVAAVGGRCASFARATPTTRSRSIRSSPIAMPCSTIRSIAKSTPTICAGNSRACRSTPISPYGSHGARRC
jgi:hypothetical protein